VPFCPNFGQTSRELAAFRGIIWTEVEFNWPRFGQILLRPKEGVGGSSPSEAAIFETRGLHVIPGGIPVIRSGFIFCKHHLRLRLNPRSGSRSDKNYSWSCAARDRMLDQRSGLLERKGCTSAKKQPQMALT